MEDAAGSGGSTVIDDGAVSDAPGPADTEDEAPGDDAGPRPVPLHWVKEVSVGSGYRALGGTGPNDIWLVGDEGTAMHSDGSGVWVANDAQTAGRMTGVWGTAPDNVYFSLEINLVLRWNGKIFERQTDGVPIGSTFYATWGSGPTDVYVVGALFHSMGDGHWTYLSMPDTLGPILGIWGSGPNDVWAMGNDSVYRKKADGRWYLEPTGYRNGNLAIWGSGPTDVYIAHGGEILHTVGDGKWTSQTFVPKSIVDGAFYVWGSGPDDIYAGPSGGGLLHSLGDGHWYREVLDTKFPNVGNEGIWGTSRNNVYVYCAGSIYHGT